MKCIDIDKASCIYYYEDGTLKSSNTGFSSLGNRPQGVTIRNRGPATEGSAAHGGHVEDMAPVRVRL